MQVIMGMAGMMMVGVLFVVFQSAVGTDEPLAPSWKQGATTQALDTVTVVVAEHGRNGKYEQTDPEGVSVEVARGSFSDDKPFCPTLRQLANLASPKVQDVPAEGCTAFSVNGTMITTYDGLRSGVKYFTFPEKRPFIWPTVAVGNKVEIPFSDEDDRESREAIVLETISIKPRVFRIHNFVSEQEREAMIARAKALKMERSTGGLQKEDSEGTENQGEYISDRTSTNAWDTSSPLAMKIKKRSFDLMRMVFKDDWSDGLQVVRYEPPQFYNSHQDWFDVNASPNWNWDPANGGVNRFATVFLYLNDVELGGETLFPRSSEKMEANDYRVEDFNRLADELMTPNSTVHRMAHQCRTGFRVAPRAGDAILFYNQRPAGGPEHDALHGACPVIEGVKWGANLWIWNEQTWTPEREPGYFSENREQKTARNAEFHNDGDATVDIYWEAAFDDLKPLGVVGPHETYRSNTFIGHVFVLKQGETVLGRFEIENEKKSLVQVWHVGGANDGPRHREL